LKLHFDTPSINNCEFVTRHVAVRQDVMCKIGTCVIRFFSAVGITNSRFFLSQITNSAERGQKIGDFFARFFSFLKDLQYFYSLNLKLCWGNDFKRSFTEEIRVWWGGFQ
jgi:hypothetical protein